MTVLLFILFVCPARAQLAKNFYYINRIESRVLPNAVQVIIRTDGVVQFGVDLAEVFEVNANGSQQPRPTTRLRLRFLKARAKLPAFNEVGTYPVDGAYISPGRDELQIALFKRFSQSRRPGNRCRTAFLCADFAAQDQPVRRFGRHWHR